MSNHTEETGEKLRCFKERAQDTPSLFQGGKLVLQNYHIGWIITGIFTFIACVVSFWLVDKHLRNYTNKHEQRYIVRILFMVPIYALVSFASFLFWNHATLLILVRDCYESTVLTAFFYLLLLYLSPNTEGQRQIFLKVGLSREADEAAYRRGDPPKKWMFPFGSVKWKPRDGLYFLQLMKWGVLQYCVIRPATTLAAVILEYLGLYCEESWGLGWGHPYIVIIVSISVSVAMYCLIQLYLPVSVHLASQRPLLKLFAIKAVVFLTFWQATFLSVLSLIGVVKPTTYMTAADVNIGIGAILETVEMTIFALLHVRAFSYKPYVVKLPTDLSYSTIPHTPRFRSLGHAFDFRETFKEIWQGIIYMGYKFRKKEVPEDIRPRRTQAYGVVFGKDRGPGDPSTVLGEKQDPRTREIVDPDDEKALPTLPVIDEVELGLLETKPRRETRDWLSMGNARHLRKETTDLGVQIERELQRRGIDVPDSQQVDPPQLPVAPRATPGPSPAVHIRHPTWWRRIYSRFSEHSTPLESEPPLGPIQSGRAGYHPVDLDDLPPPSQLLSRRDSRYPTKIRSPIEGLPGQGSGYEALPVTSSGHTQEPSESWLYPSFPMPPSRSTNTESPGLVSREPRGNTERTRPGQYRRDGGLQRQTRIERTPRVHRRESALYHDS